MGITGIKKRLGNRHCFPKVAAIVTGKLLNNFLGGEKKKAQTLELVNLGIFMFRHSFICTANKLIGGLTVLVHFGVWGTASFIRNIFLSHHFSTALWVTFCRSTLEVTRSAKGRGLGQSNLAY